MSQPIDPRDVGHRGSPSDAGEWRNLRNKRGEQIGRWNKRTKKLIIYFNGGRDEFYLGEHYSENGPPRQNSTDVLG